jgi:hypothetical protein
LADVKLGTLDFLEYGKITTNKPETNKHNEGQIAACNGFGKLLIVDGAKKPATPVAQTIIPTTLIILFAMLAPRYRFERRRRQLYIVASISTNCGAIINKT